MDREGTPPIAPDMVAPGDEPSRVPTDDRRPRYGPALLDALIPGLGHLVTGRRSRGVLLIAPILVGVAAVVWIVATTPGPRLVAELLASEVIWALLVIQVLLFGWRLVAVASSLSHPRPPRLGRRDVLPVALLAVILVVPQVFAGYATEVARETADEVFVTPPPIAEGPSFTPEPDPSNLATPEPTGSLDPSLSPEPSATPTVPRITGLIVGVDSGIGRSTYLTDTMIVVSLDPVAATVSLISIPRDMVDVPLGDGRKYRGKINSLVAYARRSPRQFPGTNGTGFDVLRDALGTLLREPIQYYAKVDLGGFVRVVDTLGGVNVNVARGFCDPKYREYGYPNGFSITAGRHHLNGLQALAYARVRRPLGESDFTRAARQQEVVSGVRDAIVKGDFLNDPVGLLKAIGQTVETDVPRKALPALADAASRVGRSETYRAVITHPLVRSGYDNRGSIQIPDLKRIRALAAELFPVTGTVPRPKFAAPKNDGKVNGSGVGGCAPAATPKPTAKPTPKPKPSAKPTATPTPEPSAAAS